MTKSLNDILKRYSDVISGKNPSSTVSTLTTGENPGVDYADKMKDGRDFIAQHSVEKFDDRVGNGDDVYQATNVKKAAMERHGHEPKPKDIKVYKKNQQVGQAENKLKEAKDESEYGNEGEMAVTQLKTIMRNAEHLIKMMKPDTDLPEWVQSKITKAEDYISTAHDYLMSEMNEETINEISSARANDAYHGAMDKMKKFDIMSVGSSGKKKKKLLALADKKQAQAQKFADYSDKKKIKEETELTEAKCNMSEAGKMCEVHGNKACPKEDSASDKEPRYNGKKKEGRQLITDKKNIQEVLTRSTSVKKVMDDFMKSDDPRFKGDSKEKRKERALAAWYKMHPEKSNKVNESIADQRSAKSTASEKAREKIMDGIQKKKLQQEKMKEQAAPAETAIKMPSGAVGDTGRV